jgi:hypothetical protein
MLLTDSAVDPRRAAVPAHARTGRRRVSRSPTASTRFLATDGVARFARVGSAFLGIPVAPEQVQLVDL